MVTPATAAAASGGVDPPRRTVPSTEVAARPPAPAAISAAAMAAYVIFAAVQANGIWAVKSKAGPAAPALQPPRAADLGRKDKVLEPSPATPALPPKLKHKLVRALPFSFPFCFCLLIKNCSPRRRPRAQPSLR